MNQEIEIDVKRQKKDLIRLLSFLKKYKVLLTFAFIFLFLATACEMYGPILVKRFLDDHLMKRYFPKDAIVTLFSIYVAITIGKIVLSYLQLLMFQQIAFKVVQDIRMKVYEHVHSLAFSFFDKTPIGSIVSRITNDTEAIKDFYVSVLATFIQQIVFLVGIIIAMYSLDAKLATICVGLVFIVYFIILTYRKKSFPFFMETRGQLSNLNAKLNEHLQGMSIIQAFNQQKRLQNEFEEVNKSHFNAGVKTIRLDSLFLRPATDLIYTIGIMFVLSFFGITSFSNPVEIGTVYAFVSYLERFFEPITQMMMKLSLLQQAVVSSSRVFDLMDEEQKAPTKVGTDLPKVKEGSIDFKNVSFSYDGVHNVIHDISFSVKPGQSVAFVGHTGSGKSTIMNLLLRFYDVKDGEIQIDQQKLSTFEESELRSNIGLVLQDPYLFVGDIKGNISMYNNKITEREIKEASELVRANEFIEKLPNGYDEAVVERGSTLSSGQRQLITFARTIAAKPTILILDEATANIDSETEEAIQEALTEMRKGRTTVIIAHRLSTIQDVDCIYVLHKGKIVEEGNHQQLLAKQGLYYNMYLLQNKGSLLLAE
ncbi:ABC transporter transmembrane domain-containing protein [Bacillus sp. AFS055030]|uniref:ABC transporter ATP-binding protein n=1 Tax=Bacillus sp. AFS055030 TaxID=2033507 RepID=UPI000BFBB6CC|nr:ABC transporter transmembrane domain-containing protein [Bacillus sp. AFS055030]PGL68822.1 multidrug ABC transporter ATP-binding protein [Bacillus sp. AFS055030]